MVSAGALLRGGRVTCTLTTGRLAARLGVGHVGLGRLLTIVHFVRHFVGSADLRVLSGCLERLLYGTAA